MMEHTVRMNDQQHAEDRETIDGLMGNFAKKQNIQITVALQSNSDHIQKIDRLLESIKKTTEKSVSGVNHHQPKING